MKHSKQLKVTIISSEDREQLRRLAEKHPRAASESMPVPIPAWMPVATWQRLRLNECLRSCSRWSAFFTDWGRLNVERDAEGVAAWLMEPDNE